MPIFEYSCKDCNESYEILHKRAEDESIIECPSCHSKQHVKKLSVFAPAAGSSEHYDAPCASGSCGMPSYSGCANGVCGLN